MNTIHNTHEALAEKLSNVEAAIEAEEAVLTWYNNLSDSEYCTNPFEADEKANAAEEHLKSLEEKRDTLEKAVDACKALEEAMEELEFLETVEGLEGLK